MAIPPILQVQKPTRADRQSEQQKSAAAQYRPSVPPKPVYVPPASLAPRPAALRSSSPASFSSARAPTPVARAAGAKPLQSTAHRSSSTVTRSAPSSTTIQRLVQAVAASLGPSPWNVPSSIKEPGPVTAWEIGRIQAGLGSLGQHFLEPPPSLLPSDTDPNAHLPGAGFNPYPQIPNVVAPWPGAKIPKLGKPYYGGGIQRFKGLSSGGGNVRV